MLYECVGRNMEFDQRYVDVWEEDARGLGYFNYLPDGDIYSNAVIIVENIPIEHML